MEQKLLWQTKLAARLHDPVEKALILMRTTEGHEGGTSQLLRKKLGLEMLLPKVKQAVTKADHWASAADRVAFPNRNADGRYPAWQNVRFHEQPVITHPLTGEQFDLGKLTDILPEAAKVLAQDHLHRLIHADSLQKTALAFWRFGPEIDSDEIKNLWAQLPADTRIPDHTIFDHLDLTTALAGSFVQDEAGPALLAVSLGPVQEFIAAARSSSDLWAGSHLLSRISWEAMKVICEKLGPEAILFPRLRGVPQVDLWLREECGINAELFEKNEWTYQSSDANPLFIAALPNRFTAMIPSGQAEEIAQLITDSVRDWILKQSKSVYKLLLSVAAERDTPDLPGYKQMEDQLAGFPEVYWAVVPTSLVDRDESGKVLASCPTLAAAMQSFFESSSPGFLNSNAWNLISGGVDLEEGWFWRPNPGSLYPALHDLLERALAATKSVRIFGQTSQQGWRDSLSGDAEWLTTDRKQLDLPSGQRTNTLWGKISSEKPAWAKQGEHLSALNALKRLWPTLFIREELKSLDLDVTRFVVSTHTMAMATSLANVIRKKPDIDKALRKELTKSKHDRVPLPRKLAIDLLGGSEGHLISRIPGWLERIRESEDDVELRKANRLLRDYLGSEPEAYYGMILMDGDQMGAWLSSDPEIALPHQASYHPQIRAGIQSFSADQNLKRYSEEKRAPSPSRHMAISEALNNFALTLAPEVVERQFHGRVIYAGGDDLMAMFPVMDMLPAMATLRAAYSGIHPKEMGAEKHIKEFQKQANGYIFHKGRLLRVMGDKATASCGAVIAHHQSPLSAVLRELRSAEKRAKTEKRAADGKNRNAFSLSIIKRSGGALRLTAKWGEPVRLLIRLRDFLSESEVSRRAVYNTSLWLKDLPPIEGDGEMAAVLLAYQFSRQSGGRKTTWDYHDLTGLAKSLVQQSVEHTKVEDRLSWIENLLSIAEFLARETRSPANETGIETRGVVG